MKKTGTNLQTKIHMLKSYVISMSVCLYVPKNLANFRHDMPLSVGSGKIFLAKGSTVTTTFVPPN